MNEITYGINSYDKDGDVFDKCFRININNFITLKFNNLEELEHFSAEIIDCISQIKEDLGE